MQDLAGTLICQSMSQSGSIHQTDAPEQFNALQGIMGNIRCNDPSSRSTSLELTCTFDDTPNCFDPPQLSACRAYESDDDYYVDLWEGGVIEGIRLAASIDAGLIIATVIAGLGLIAGTMCAARTTEQDLSTAFCFGCAPVLALASCLAIILINTELVAGRGLAHESIEGSMRLGIIGFSLLAACVLLNVFATIMVGISVPNLSLRPNDTADIAPQDLTCFCCCVCIEHYMCQMGSLGDWLRPGIFKGQPADAEALLSFLSRVSTARLLVFELPNLIFLQRVSATVGSWLALDLAVILIVAQMVSTLVRTAFWWRSASNGSPMAVLLANTVAACIGGEQNIVPE